LNSIGLKYPIVESEALDIVEHVDLDLIPMCAVRSVFGDKKKLSIAALSQDVPGSGHRADDAVIGHQSFELFSWQPIHCRGLHLRRQFMAVRPEGANHQWRKIPPRELSIDLVADERLGRVTGRAGAS